MERNAAPQAEEATAAPSVVNLAAPMGAPAPSEKPAPWQDYQTVFTNAKAGMDSVDKAYVQKVVYEMSKDSAHFRNEQRKQAQVDARITQLRARSEALTPAELAAANRSMDQRIASLESRRDLTRTWLHADMDCFYAAVHEAERPELKRVPLAIGGMGMISTANYVARKFGVRSAMPGFIGKRLCPQLVFIAPDFKRYTAAAERVRAVFRQLDPDFESGGLDEAYLDVTDFCATMGCSGAEAAEELRRRVREQCGGLTCSCGVAPNKMLAKICSDINKPDGQYVLPPSRSVIMSFLDTLPTRKIPCIGKVTEQQLRGVLGVSTCGQLLGPQRGRLPLLFSEASAGFFLEAALGLAPTRHAPKTDTSLEPGRKGISCERTFRNMSNPREQEAMARQLVESLAADMAKEQLEGRNLTLKLKLSTFEVRTRAATLPRHVRTPTDMLPTVLRLLRGEGQMELRLMGVRMAALRKVNTAVRSPLARLLGLRPQRRPEEGPEPGPGAAVPAAGDAAGVGTRALVSGGAGPSGPVRSCCQPHQQPRQIASAPPQGAATARGGGGGCGGGGPAACGGFGAAPTAAASAGGAAACAGDWATRTTDPVYGSPLRGWEGAMSTGGCGAAAAGAGRGVGLFPGDAWGQRGASTGPVTGSVLHNVEGQITEHATTTAVKDGGVVVVTPRRAAGGFGSTTGDTVSGGGGGGSGDDGVRQEALCHHEVYDEDGYLVEGRFDEFEELDEADGDKEMLRDIDAEWHGDDALDGDPWVAAHREIRDEEEAAAAAGPPAKRQRLESRDTSLRPSSASPHNPAVAAAAAAAVPAPCAAAAAAPATAVGPPTAAPSAASTWTCRVCTFGLNRRQLLRCEVCDCLRGSTEPPPPEPQPHPHPHPQQHPPHSKLQGRASAGNAGSDTVSGGTLGVVASGSGRSSGGGIGFHGTGGGGGGGGGARGRKGQAAGGHSAPPPQTGQRHLQQLWASAAAPGRPPSTAEPPPPPRGGGETRAAALPSGRCAHQSQPRRPAAAPQQQPQLPSSSSSRCCPECGAAVAASGWVEHQDWHLAVRLSRAETA